MDIQSSNDNYISNKRMRIGNISLMAAVFVLSTAYWHLYTWYSATAPFGTLVAAVFLAVTFFCYADIKYALKDTAFWLMVFADVIALINLFVIHSNKGAILTIADFMLILYLANKVSFSKKESIISAIYVGAFFIYWTIDVKGYFKGYNTNYGGLVLISGFVFLMVAITYLFKYLNEHDSKMYLKIIAVIMTLAVFATAFKIISWYRSRCALMGLLVFVILYFIPGKLWNSKILYGIVTALGSIGAVIFSAVYVWLGIMKEQFTIRIFYKDILSGREEIWKELWEEYLKKPFTGIGSSYVMKLDWMEGLFEVHSGLLDILIVHGLVVFIICCTFLVFRLTAIRKYVINDNISKCAMAGIYAMLVTSFMENYIIVAPYSVLFLILFAIINGRENKNSLTS